MSRNVWNGIAALVVLALVGLIASCGLPTEWRARCEHFQQDTAADVADGDTAVTIHDCERIQ